MPSSAHQIHQMCKEAIMAEITFNTADPEERVREQVKAAVVAYHDMLDTFVSRRARTAAAEAGEVCPRQIARPCK
jgi:hypothetical protein